ncbi:hypothetical protein [Mycoplasmopsis felifaucium]|uniref:Lipoprotein n=1 Tax=Mycoplasmopsis felifaucium TaxID=35768 RepID=A0ABZ2RP93_9BACT
MKKIKKLLLSFISVSSISAVALASSNCDNKVSKTNESNPASAEKINSFKQSVEVAKTTTLPALELLGDSIFIERTKAAIKAAENALNTKNISDESLDKAVNTFNLEMGKIGLENTIKTSEFLMPSLNNEKYTSIRLEFEDVINKGKAIIANKNSSVDDIQDALLELSKMITKVDFEITNINNNQSDNNSSSQVESLKAEANKLITDYEEYINPSTLLFKNSNFARSNTSMQEFIDTTKDQLNSLTTEEEITGYISNFKAKVAELYTKPINDYIALFERQFAYGDGITPGSKVRFSKLLDDSFSSNEQYTSLKNEYTTQYNQAISEIKESVTAIPTTYKAIVKYTELLDEFLKKPELLEFTTALASKTALTSLIEEYEAQYNFLTSAENTFYKDSNLTTQAFMTTYKSKLDSARNSLSSLSTTSTYKAETQTLNEAYKVMVDELSKFSKPLYETAYKKLIETIKPEVEFENFDEIVQTIKTNLSKNKWVAFKKKFEELQKTTPTDYEAAYGNLVEEWQTISSAFNLDKLKYAQITWFETKIKELATSQTSKTEEINRELEEFKTTYKQANSFSKTLTWYNEQVAKIKTIYDKYNNSSTSSSASTTDTSASINSSNTSETTTETSSTSESTSQPDPASASATTSTR